MNRKILILLLLAVAALLAGRALRQAAPALPVSAASWTASEVNGAFVETGVNRDQHMALVLTQGGAALRLTGDPGKLQAGEGIGLHAIFDDNSSFALTGAGVGGAVEAPVDPAVLGEVTRHMAHGGVMLIAFDDQLEAPLAFPLAGAAPTLAALAGAMRHAGFAAPWGPGAAGGMMPHGWPAAPSIMAGALGLSVGWFFTMLAILYFLPAVIAYTRGSAARGIVLLLNFLLGWTVIGWWVLLVVAIASPVRMQRGLRRA